MACVTRIVMAYIVKAFSIMAYVVVACLGMAYIVMAYAGIVLYLLPMQFFCQKTVRVHRYHTHSTHSC